VIERAKFFTEVVKLLWAAAGASLAIGLTADRLTLPRLGREGQEIVMWMGIVLACVLAFMAGTLVVVAWRIIRDETARPR
jgi:hypothetical protein